MHKIVLPERVNWPLLIQRPTSEQAALEQTVREVFKAVAKDGDQAVRAYNKRYDRNDQPIRAVPTETIAAAADALSGPLKEAIGMAAGNIERFHAIQRELVTKTETTPGVTCWRESRAIETIGLYIPGGSAPLFSTVLMLGIPARLAGCSTITLCTPADVNGNIHPAILYAASVAGIDCIFGVGGIQAIAAMSMGTARIPKADKILGPGNQYVTAAKQMAQQSGTAIDMPAGPSEVLIIADHTCNPAFVAADLLAQAEHGADSQVILLSDQEEILDQCLSELQQQLAQVPRREIATAALANSKAILLAGLDDCFAFSNQYAPEHLILAINEPASHTGKIINAGSVFLGNYSCESAGDYASGTNHTLPTNGYARSYSGVSLDSFIKKITFQELSKEGVRNIGPGIELMAAAEQLWAHKNAVTLRLNESNV